MESSHRYLHILAVMSSAPCKSIKDVFSKMRTYYLKIKITNRISYQVFIETFFFFYFSSGSIFTYSMHLYTSTVVTCKLQSRLTLQVKVMHENWLIICIIASQSLHTIPYDIVKHFNSIRVCNQKNNNNRLRSTHIRRIIKDRRQFSVIV